MILAFDLATRLCGYCLGDGLSIPEAGAFELPQLGEDLGKMLDLFNNYIGLLIDRSHPVAILYEKPLLVINRLTDEYGNLLPGRTDDLLTIRKIYSLGSHLEYVARRRGIECSEVGLQAIKKEVTGNHRAKKAEIVAVAKRIGLQLPIKSKGEEDAADSWGAWLVGLRTYNPAASRRWDRLVHSPRGTLL